MCPLAIAAGTGNAQSVPGFVIETYADQVPGPIMLDFTPDGTLFAGHDPSPAGSGNPLPITRIAIGGSPVQPWGLQPTPNPDSVLVDIAGTISGVPGSVLTGGIKIAPHTGSIRAIRPDQSVVELWSSTQWTNPAEMKFDQHGRLIFNERETRTLWMSQAGESPTVLTRFPAGIDPSHLAVAPDGHLFVSDFAGGIHIVNADGDIAQLHFARMPGRASIEFGTGAGFGDDLYAMVVNTGLLYRIDDTGAASQIGSGFTGFAFDLAFGPDGRLYLSHITGGRISVIYPDDILFQHDFEP